MQKRNEVDPKNCWQTAHLYKNEEEVANEFQCLEKDAAEIVKFAGKLGEKDSLLKALRVSSDAMRRGAKLQCYADRNRDVDMSVGKWQELSGMAAAAMTKMAAASSFTSTKSSSKGKKSMPVILSTSSMDFT